MPTVREHIKKPVISNSDGKKMGKIKDLYFDLNLTKMTAAYLGQRGIIRRNKMVIKQEKVKKCGVDAWLVARSDVVVKLKDIVGSQEFVLAKELRGRQILSEGGTNIAIVDDVILDDECNVQGFTLTNVPASGPLAERKAIARGAITNLGSKTRPMTTILKQAESMEIGTTTQKGT